jgi:hypothetical protein
LSDSGFKRKKRVPFSLVCFGAAANRVRGLVFAGSGFFAPEEGSVA